MEFLTFQPLGKHLPGPISIGFLSVGFLSSTFDWRHQPEIDIHRLKRLLIGATHDVRQQRADGRFSWRRPKRPVLQFCGREPRYNYPCWPSLPLLPLHGFPLLFEQGSPGGTPSGGPVSGDVPPALP